MVRLSRLTRYYKRSRIAKWPRFARLGVVAAVFAVLGFGLIRSSHAATYGASAELESGTLAGAVQTFSDANASNGAAAAFGLTDPKAPTNLVAFTEGGNTALRWDAGKRNLPVGRTFKEYDIYRNGTQIGTVTTPQPLFPESGARGFIDNTVTNGTTYSYAVRMVDNTGAASPLSGALTVASSTTGISAPNITVDTSGAPDLASYMTGTAVPFMKVWYPKIAAKLATQFAPRTSFSIRFSTVYTDGKPLVADIGWDKNGVITINPDYARAHQNPYTWMSAMTYEMVSGYAGTINYPEWALDGLVGYGDYAMIRLNGIPLYQNVGMTYNDTRLWVSPAFFYQYAEKYDTNIVGKIMYSIKNNIYNDSLWQNYTGRTLSQLQNEWQPVPSTPAGPIKLQSIANKCLDNNYDRDATNNKLQIMDCDGASQQAWITYRQPDGEVQIKSGTSCLGTNLTVTPNLGAMYACAGYTNQTWSQKADGSLVSQASGLCLDVPNGTTTNGIQLDVVACNGSANQKFTPIP